LRDNPAQAARNCEGLEERALTIRVGLQSRVKDVGSDFDLLASEPADLMELARLYRRLGRPGEAEPLYWRAWRIWLSAPTMSPEFRRVLLSWVAVEIKNCVRGRPPGTVTAYDGPYGVLALLPLPSASRPDQ
jgi:hypothetical protein